MGDDIECCKRPTNLGKKDIKTYRGINQKKNPKIPSSNSDDFDNFGTFKQQKNSNKKGNSNLNSVYGKEKFPNFSEFDIEPVSEPLHQDNISQPQPLYENAQYIESNSPNLPQNQIIQDTTNYINSTNLSQNQIIQDTTNYINSTNLSQNQIIQDNTNYISPSNLQQNQIIQDTTKYIDTTEKYIQPQTKILTQNQFQTEFDSTKVNNYETNIETNYIPSSTTQDYNINYNSQPIEYINSNQSENITNITSDQYGNSQKILPTKYIQIQRPVIYADNAQNETPIENYIESPSNFQSYQQYTNISDISSNNNIEYNISPITNVQPQYYESNNTVSYLPPKIETVYTPPSQYSQTREVQYTNIPSNISYVEQPQQVYHSQRPKQILVQQRNNQIYISKVPNDNENKKPKKLKKKRKIIEYYSEDDEEEEQEEEINEEPSQSQSQSLYDEIKEQKKFKNKKIKTKNNNKKHNEEDVNMKRANKNVRKQKIYSIEDKENESDNIENIDNDKNIRRNQNKIIPKNINKRKVIENQRDDEEFSEFQKEPEMIRESLENSSNNFNSYYENRINDETNFNKMNKRQAITLRDGNKIVGNFKEEEILDKNEMAEKEREELFRGQTLKSSSVEKKVESTGCQIPGFISNIFNKIF